MVPIKKIFKRWDGALTRQQRAEMVRRGDGRGKTAKQGIKGGMAATGQARVRGSKTARWHQKGKEKDRGGHSDRRSKTAIHCKGKAERLGRGSNETGPGAKRGHRRGETEKGHSDEFVDKHGREVTSPATCPHNLVLQGFSSLIHCW